MSAKEPPVVLVQTWIHLLVNGDDVEVKKRAKEMLLNAFGDMKAVSEYAKKHNFKVTK